MNNKSFDIYLECLNYGLKPNIYIFGYGVPLSFDKHGNIFLNTTKGFHYLNQRNFLDLEKFPNLTPILEQLKNKDPKLKEYGGRIFVGKNAIFTRYGEVYIPIFGNQNFNRI